MKKFLKHIVGVAAILLCVALMPISAFAEAPARVQNFEGEVFINFTHPIFKIPGFESRIDVGLGAELRYNLKHLPLSAGIFAQNYYPDYHNEDETQNFNMHNNGGNLFGILAEYNHNRGGAFNPFVSVGFGLGNMHIVGRTSNGPSKCTPALRLKVGMEFVHHIRLSATGTFTKRDLCGVSVSLGFVIGGRPKKK